MKNDKWIETKKFFPEALLIATLTIVGYLGAFFYQYSYLQYFQIPFLLIDVNLPSVLLVTAFGILILSLIFLVFDYFLRSQKINDNKHLKFIAKIFLVVLLFLILLIVSYDPASTLHTVMRTLLFAIIVTWNFVLLRKNKLKLEEGSLLKRVEGFYGSFPVLFVSVLILFVLTCGVSGSIVAKLKVDYLVTDTTPQIAIVSTYTGNLLGVTFNADSRVLGGNVTILSQDRISSSGILLKNRKIGPLKRSLEGASIYEIMFPGY